MIVRKRELRRYQTLDGRAPFWEWLYDLKDLRARATIINRLERFAEGNPGHWRLIGHGIHELKIDFGPGYRVYFGEENLTLVILLCGGDKDSQRKDIQKAYAYWEDYKRRIYGTESKLS